MPQTKFRPHLLKTVAVHKKQRNRRTDIHFWFYISFLTRSWQSPDYKRFGCVITVYLDHKRRTKIKMFGKFRMDKTPGIGKTHYRRLPELTPMLWSLAAGIRATYSELRSTDRHAASAKQHPIKILHSSNQSYAPSVCSSASTLVLRYLERSRHSFASWLQHHWK